MNQNKFKGFDIKSSQVAPQDKVTSLPIPRNPSVQDFQISRIQGQTPSSYSDVKAKFGSLAQTDPERALRSHRDRRFKLDSLLTDPLRVQEEEKRALEERVKEHVEELAKKARETAVKEGYQEGYEKGYSEALQKIKVDYADQLDSITSLVQSAESAKDQIYRANEHFLMEMVYRIGKMVLLRELSTDPEFILRLAKELVTRLGVRDHILMKISAEDAGSIDSLREGLTQAFGHLENLRFEVVAGLKKGGIQVETEWKSIDATIETQLKGLFEGMIGNFSLGDA